MRKKKEPAIKRGRGKPKKWTDVELFTKKVDAYFDECDAKGAKDNKEGFYNLTGLALYLGFLDRHTLLSYDEALEFSPVLKKARARIEEQRTEWLCRGKGWGPGLMFDLKNNFGWADVMHLAGPGGEPLALEMSSLEVAARVMTILELARVKREERDVETVQKALPEKVL
jgi:hypothetical protein